MRYGSMLALALALLMLSGCRLAVSGTKGACAVSTGREIFEFELK